MMFAFQSDRYSGLLGSDQIKGGWRDGAAVKNLGFSSGGLGFHSQHLQEGGFLDFHEHL